MTTLNMPTLSRTAPSSIIFSLRANTMRSESPLNGAVQTAELPGARWVASFSWQNLSAADARILKAWLNSLRGMAGRFYLHDYSHPTPSGTYGTAGTVNGAGQAGGSITALWPLLRYSGAVRCDNATITCDSTSFTCDSGDIPPQNALLPGDYIGIGGELKVVTEPVNVGETGTTTIKFEPPLRTSPPDGTALVLDRPKCTMMLVDDEQDKFMFEPGGNVPSVQIDCMEVF